MLTRRSFILSASAAPVAAMALPSAALAAKTTSKPAIFTRGDLAIDGYDPVAYFTANAPVKGDAAHQVMWSGAPWQFANEEHKAMFEADPERYAPQYGGYCSYAAALNYVAPTDAGAWSLHNGRLFLNYSRNVRRIWEMNKDEYIAQADENWPGPLFI